MKTPGKRGGSAIAPARSMDRTEFDRLIARASNPGLIPGIYNYCDGRCPRCSFTDRCLVYLDHQELKSVHDGASLAETVGASLQRTLEMITEVACREGLDLVGPVDPVSLQPLEEDDVATAAEVDLDRHRQDPLAVRAREYGHLAWRIGRAIGPVVAARADAPVIEAVETIEWFSSMISSKIYRAVCGQAEGWETHDEVQTDFNGSAKIALVGIAESRRAWDLLMETGRATADGVPAQAARMLDELDVSVRERFPHVMAFVRPGFDEPVKTGAGR
jgi:hypothetical protein